MHDERNWTQDSMLWPVIHVNKGNLPPSVCVSGREIFPWTCE